MHKKFRVNTFQAIVFNYFFCVLTGLITEMKIPSIPFEGKFITAYMIAGIMGIFFVSTFYFSALATNRVGIAVISLSGRLSLIIPVLVNIFIFKSIGTNFGLLNIFGLIIAILAIILSIIKFGKTANTEKFEENKSPQIFRNDMIWFPILIFLITGFMDTALNFVSLNYVGSDYAADFSILLFLCAGLSGAVALLYRYIKTGEKIQFRSVVAGLCLGFPNYFSVYLMFVVLREFNNNGALVFPVFNISVIIVSFLTAIVFFKEKFYWYNFIGLAFAILAIVMIAS